MKTLQNLFSNLLPINFMQGGTTKKINRQFFIYSEDNSSGFKEQLNNSLHFNASLLFRDKMAGHWD